MIFSTQKITDLCCVVNAFEGYDIAYPTSETPKKRKIYNRQRKAITDCIINEANILYHEGVTLRRLSNALQKGGWDDNYFVSEHGTLMIKDVNGRS